MPMTCAGLPFVGARAVTPIEREMLADRAESFRIRSLLWAIASLLGVPLFVASLVLTLFNLPPAILSLIMIAVLGYCLWTPMRWLEARKNSRTAARAAQAEVIDRFAGAVDSSAHAEPGLGQLVAAGLDLEGLHQAIERNPISGEVLYVNGVALVRPILTGIAEVADTPAAANPLFPGIVAEKSFGDHPTRGLSASELRELETLHRRVLPRFTPFQWFTLIMTIALAVGIILSARSDRTYVIWAAMGVFVLGSVASSIVRLFRWRERVRQDLRGAVVVLVRQDEHDVEYLPNMKAAWTIDGKPAPWRHRMSLRRVDE